MAAPGQVWGMEGRQLLKLGNAIEDFAEKQFPIVNGMALNRAAAVTRQEYVKIVERRFTLRNKGTFRSIQYQKVKGLNPKNQESVVGSTMDYMADQEFGKTKTSSGKKGLAIPTTTASNESISSKPRRKTVSRPRRRGAIGLTKAKVRSSGRKQFISATIQAVARKGSGLYAYLPIQGAKGIYRITGKKDKAKIKMVYSLSKKTIKIDKAPSLTPAVNNIIPRIPGYYVQAAEKRLGKSFKL